MLSNAALVSGHKAVHPRNERVLDLAFNAMLAGWERTVLNGRTLYLNHEERVSRPAVS